MTARFVVFHILFALCVILVFNMAAMSTAQAPGAAFARTLGIMADDGRTGEVSLSRDLRAGQLLGLADFRTRLRQTFDAFGLGGWFSGFLLDRLEAIRDRRSGKTAQNPNNLHPEAILEIAGFLTGRQGGAVRARTRDFLKRVAALERVISDDTQVMDYRVAFLRHYRNRYPGAYLNDIYRQVLFSGRGRNADGKDRALAEFFSAYRDKLHVLVHASDVQLYSFFQLELVAAIEGRSAEGEKCRKSSLLWAGRTLRPIQSGFWARGAGNRSIYVWTEHDFRSEVRKLDILMSVSSRTKGARQRAPGDLQNRYGTIEYREERMVRDNFGVEYDLSDAAYSAQDKDQPYTPSVSFHDEAKIRENYCKIQYRSLSLRYNLQRKQLVRYTRELLRRRQEAIRQLAENGV